MSEESKFAFKKINYIIMLAGVITLILGFIIMTLDNQEFGFGFLGLTLGPIIVMLGFLIQFVAIFYKKNLITQQTNIHDIFRGVNPWHYSRVDRIFASQQ